MYRSLFCFAAFLLSTAAYGFTDGEKAFIQSEWNVNVDEAAAKLQNSNSENERIRDQIAAELNGPRNDFYALAQRTDRAVAKWVEIAAFLMERRGHGRNAQKIRDDYQWHYTNHFTDAYVFGFSHSGDPDHDPFSLWLELAYQLLLAAVGETTVKLLHLDDIHEINYSVPVTFQPAGDDRVDPIRKWEQEYYVFYTSEWFAGPVTYWSVYLICVGASYGTAILFACSPIGMASEIIVADYVAPPIAERVWTRFNP